MTLVLLRVTKCKCAHSGPASGAHRAGTCTPEPRGTPADKLLSMAEHACAPKFVRLNDTDLTSDPSGQLPWKIQARPVHLIRRGLDVLVPALREFFTLLLTYQNPPAGVNRMSVFLHRSYALRRQGDGQPKLVQLFHPRTTGQPEPDNDPEEAGEAVMPYLFMQATQDSDCMPASRSKQRERLSTTPDSLAGILEVVEKEQGDGLSDAAILLKALRKTAGKQLKYWVAGESFEDAAQVQLACRNLLRARNMLLHRSFLVPSTEPAQLMQLMHAMFDDMGVLCSHMEKVLGSTQPKKLLMPDTLRTDFQTRLRYVRFALKDLILAAQCMVEPALRGEEAGEQAAALLEVLLPQAEEAHAMLSCARELHDDHLEAANRMLRLHQLVVGELPQPEARRVVADAEADLGPEETDEGFETVQERKQSPSSPAVHFFWRLQTRASSSGIEYSRQPYVISAPNTFVMSTVDLCNEALDLTSQAFVDMFKRVWHEPTTASGRLFKHMIQSLHLEANLQRVPLYLIGLLPSFREDLTAEIKQRSPIFPPEDQIRDCSDAEVLAQMQWARLCDPLQNLRCIIDAFNLAEILLDEPGAQLQFFVVPSSDWTVLQDLVSELGDEALEDFRDDLRGLVPLAQELLTLRHILAHQLYYYSPVVHTMATDRGGPRITIARTADSVYSAYQLANGLKRALMHRSSPVSAINELRQLSRDVPRVRGGKPEPTILQQSRSASSLPESIRTDLWRMGPFGNRVRMTSPEDWAGLAGQVVAVLRQVQGQLQEGTVGPGYCRAIYDVLTRFNVLAPMPEAAETPAAITGPAMANRASNPFAISESDSSDDEDAAQA